MQTLLILIHTLLLSLRALWVLPLSHMLHGFRTSGKTPSNSDSSPSPLPLVLYSQVAWDDVWQRPQEMAVGLARHRQVLFLGPVQVHTRMRRYAATWQRLRTAPQQPALRIASPLVFPGEYKWRWARALNRALIHAETIMLLRQCGFADGAYLFLTNSPFCDALAQALRPRAIVYDVIDDFVAFGWAPPEGRQQEQRLLESAHKVFTGTQTLERQMKSRHPDVTFIACGVDFERYASGASQPAPPDLAALPRPILGYMGTLSDRLDRALLGALPGRFPQTSLVFIGPVHGSFGPRISAPNVHYLGLRPPEALAAYVARFDVALMPFAQTEAARAINPVKTLEYLAAGCPVISTPIPDVERFYSDLVDIAPAVEPFCEAVAHRIAHPDASRRQRGIERARARSWQAMCDEMDLRLRELETPNSTQPGSGC